MKILAVVTTLLLLAGCGYKTENLDSWIETVKSKKAGPLEPIPGAPEYDRMVYEAHSLREPFSPYKKPMDAAQVAKSLIRPDPDRVREPLELFALDSLKMVGSMGSGNGLNALMTDPNGVTHRIRVGQRLGQRDGKVVEISQERMILVELVADGFGGWEETESVVNLSEK